MYNSFRCSICGAEYPKEDLAKGCGGVDVWSTHGQRIYEVGERVVFSPSTELGSTKHNQTIGTVIRRNIEERSHRLLSYRISYSEDKEKPDHETSARNVTPELVSLL